ncbi:pneumococcal surface protein PspC, LPXTG-anchored form [Streptococcus pneumoniae]|nr:pneumococcal surface protein PspC, LPXTG-anchored form [Streptococcus pneumoniae]
MFASKSERKVHYSIRKFSIGVASVVVASLFLGGVVHATEKEGSTQVVTSSNMAKTEHRKAAKQVVDKYIEKMLSEIQLDKRKHTQNLAFNIKLSRIQTEYLRKLNVLKEKSEAELPSEIKAKLDAAFEQFKKDTLKPGEKVEEAQKKVAEAEKKAKDQKEEDRRNYPTNTYKTLELDIAESDVEVKKAELELVKEEAKESRDEEKINQAKAKVESKKAEATRLEKIKTDRKKAEEAKQEIEALVVKHKGREIDLERTKAKTVIAKYLTGLLDDIKKNLKKEQHINTVELIKKLGDIKRTYLYKLDESTQKAQLQELVTESQSKLDEAFSKFKNGLSSSSSSGSSTKPETPQPEKPEHQKPTTPAPDTKPSPQPEGKKPSVPDINQEKEKAKLAVATYMSKILDDIQKHHLQKEKHRQIVALIKELDELKKQALSEIDNVNTKVEIENTVHKIFADMDAVVTKFKKGLTQDTPKEPGNKKPSAPKPGMQPSPQPEVKPQLEKPKPEVKPQPEKPKPEVKPQPEKPKPEVKPQPEKPKPEVKPQLEKPKPEVKPQLEKPKPEVKPQPEKPKPEVKPQPEKPKPEVKPQPEKPKPEVKPQPEKPKPEVKPQLEKPKPEVKPQPEKPKPEVKPQPEKPKPEVKPQLEKPKPDNSKTQADDKKPSTTNNLSKDKQPSNQASTNEKATNKPKKSLPSTGSISNLALEIAGLLTLAGATILAKKRMK